MRKMYLFILLFSVLFLGACQASSDTEPSEPIDTSEPTNELIELTLEELAFYDGKEGRPAYIAVNGYIYDVSDSIFWSSGNHNGYSAGQDLTDAIINQSPHGTANLSRVPLIGILVLGDE